jgi:hypothetical protein
MSAQHARAARRERQAAELLGSKRVRRRPYERAPDVEPVKLGDGTVLVPESKTRGKLPKWIVGAVEQARGYLPGAVPLVVLSQTGGEPLGLLPLRDLSRLLGIRTEGAETQLPLAPQPDELQTISRELGDVERRVLYLLAKRLLVGQRNYGRLNLATDARDWRRERAEELAGALVYGAIGELAALI